MRLESSIERAVCLAAETRLGITNIKLNPDGSTGWPDRMFFTPGGRPLLIEFKRPGEKPRPKQVYIHNMLRKLGYDVEVHDNVEEAFASIKAAFERSLHE